jgi:hypothetical protein
MTVTKVGATAVAAVGHTNGTAVGAAVGHTTGTAVGTAGGTAVGTGVAAGPHPASMAATHSTEATINMLFFIFHSF